MQAGIGHGHGDRSGSGAVPGSGRDGDGNGRRTDGDAGHRTVFSDGGDARIGRREGDGAVRIGGDVDLRRTALVDRQGGGDGEGRIERAGEFGDLEVLHLPGTGLGSGADVLEPDLHLAAGIFAEVDFAGVHEGVAHGGRIVDSGELFPGVAYAATGPDRGFLLRLVDGSEIVHGMLEGKGRLHRFGQVHQRGDQPALGHLVAAVDIGRPLHVLVAIMGVMRPDKGQAFGEEDIIDDETTLAGSEGFLVRISLGGKSRLHNRDLELIVFHAGRVGSDQEGVLHVFSGRIGRECDGDRPFAGTLLGRDGGDAVSGDDRPVDIARHVDFDGRVLCADKERLRRDPELRPDAVIDQEVLDFPGSRIFGRAAVLEGNLHLAADIVAEVDGTGLDKGPAEGGRIIDGKLGPVTVHGTDKDLGVRLRRLNGGELVQRMLEGKHRRGSRTEVDPRGNQPGHGGIRFPAHLGAGLHAVLGVIRPDVSEFRRTGDILDLEIADADSLERFRIRERLGVDAGHRAVEGNIQRLDEARLEFDVGGKDDFLRGGTTPGAVGVLAFDFDLQAGPGRGGEGLDDGVDFRI